MMVVGIVVLFLVTLGLLAWAGSHFGSASTHPWKSAGAREEVISEGSLRRDHLDVCYAQWFSHLGTRFLPVSRVENAWRRQVKMVSKNDVRNGLKLSARLD
jgi:hypothetical protein